MIGIAGGIGSGKSAVARGMVEAGLWLSDSDASVREILTRPEIRETLRSWWGDRILGEEGSVNRRAVADIVFHDAGQRRRLEALLHPLVHQDRRALRAMAAAAGARGIVLDAPLLFEAGLDAECDAVVFVDVPREVRLQRVRDTRGWTEGELERRERSQMPLEDKRRRSDVVFLNDGPPEELPRRVEALLAELLPPGSGRVVKKNRSN